MNLVVLHQSGVVFPILQVLYIYMTAFFFFFKWTIFYLGSYKIVHETLLQGAS